MPQVGKRIRLVNPARRRRRRNLSIKQLLHFGTKRQRTAAKARLSRRRSGNPKGLSWNSYLRAKAKKAGLPVRRRNSSKPKRVGNVGEILTVLPGLNPGRRKRTKKRRVANKSMATMAQKRALRKARAARKRNLRMGNPSRRRHRRRSYRRTSNPVVRRHRRRRSNPVYYAKRRRRSNPGNYRRKHYRRRNPGFMSGSMGKVVGVVGGAAVTSIVSNMLPASFNTGIMGYIASGIVAVVQGKVLGKVLKSSAAGNDFMIGGFTYVGLKVLTDFFPSLAAYSPFKLSGMGLIGPSSFYVPQVNQPGSMGRFVVPSAIPAPVVVQQSGGMHGMGAVRRVGRMR